MKYTLYHKELPVITFEISDKGYVKKIYKVENKEHIPLQFLEKGKLIEDDNYYDLEDKITRWMVDRGVPSSRKNINAVLAKLKISSTSELAQKSCYLSLFDQYWTAPTEENIDWKEINFFTNKFSDYVGALMIEITPNGRSESTFHSPNNTAQGNLEKKWCIKKDGKRVLYKSGSGSEQLEPFNEVLAYEICQRLGIPHVEYTLSFIQRKHFSICNNFINKDTELITAYQLCSDIADHWNVEITLDDLLERCQLYKIPVSKVDLGVMFALDFIIANTDRHTNNFGFIRDANTLEWIGMAPIYDSGNSMFMYAQDFELEENGTDSRSIPAKPFAVNQMDQLMLFPLDEISKRMDLSRLDGIEIFYRDLLMTNKRNISPSKIIGLANVLKSRVNELKEILNQS